MQIRPGFSEGCRAGGFFVHWFTPVYTRLKPWRARARIRWFFTAKSTRELARRSLPAYVSLNPARRDIDLISANTAVRFPFTGNTRRFICLPLLLLLLLFYPRVFTDPLAPRSFYCRALRVAAAQGYKRWSLWQTVRRSRGEFVDSAGTWKYTDPRDREPGWPLKLENWQIHQVETSRIRGAENLRIRKSVNETRLHCNSIPFNYETSWKLGRFITGEVRRSSLNYKTYEF